MKFYYFAILRRIYDVSNRIQKRHFFLVSFISLFVALMDLLVLGLLGPTLQLVSTGAIKDNNAFVDLLNNLIASNSRENQEISVAFVFLFTFVVSGFSKLSLVFYQHHFAYKLVADFNREIVSDYVTTPLGLKNRNMRTSELIAAVHTKTLQLITCGVLPTINMLTACLHIILIIVGLAFIYSNAIFLSLLALGLLVSFFYYLAAGSLNQSSASINTGQNSSVKIVQEITGAIRDIQLFRLREHSVTNFYQNELRYRKALAKVQIVIAALRPTIELGVALAVCIAAYAYAVGIYIPVTVENLMPIFGVSAYAVHRIFPGLQIIFGSFTAVKGNMDSLSDALTFLEAPYRPSSVRKASINFDEHIILEKVSFAYQGKGKEVLANVNLRIPKGKKVLITGPSGSGKSTLVDIISGFSFPTEGNVYIDTHILGEETIEEWQKKISYVSQKPFIFDASLAENVSPGLAKSEIDDEKVRDVLKKVNLLDFANSLPTGIWSEVGESGGFLSGGQKQRLALARSLYFERELFIIDEATNALDNITRAKVIDIIYGIEGLTVIEITHDVVFAQNADLIIKVTDGSVEIVK